MAVVLGEDDGLATCSRPGNISVVTLSLKVWMTVAYLVHRHHVPVQLPRRVCQVLVQFLPSHIAGAAVAPVNLQPRFNGGPLLSDLRLGPVDVVVHVDAVSHRLPVVVYITRL